MEGMDWFIVNVLGPLLLPVVGILPLRLLPINPVPAGLRIMSTVKDGQLCWAVIAMGTSTVYELWDAQVKHEHLPAWGGLDLAGVILVMLAAMLVAAGGAAFSTPLRVGDHLDLRAWISHYKMFVASAAMAAIAAMVYANVHLSISP